MENQLETIKTAKKMVNIILPLIFVITIIAWFEKDRLAKYHQMHAELNQDPIQEEMSAPQFSFDYRDETYHVQPLARYELWGLVVSHNNITGILDMYHDENSVDTKDLCLIWGNNLTSNDYKKVSYSSGAWTCYYQYPYGVDFYPDALSNNHLLTADDAVRERIGQVRIGDQVHIQGMLVKYQAESNPSFWRDSSMVRTDTGDGACEVVYVESIDIIQTGAPLWHMTFFFGRWLTIGLILLRVGLMVLGVYLTPKPFRSSRWGPPE